MRIEGLMTRSPTTVTPAMTLTEAARKMKDSGVGSVVVTDEGSRPFTGSRTRATSFGLTLWLVLLGLGSLGVISAFVRWGSPAWVLQAWSLANPVEAYRMATFAILDPDVQMLGPVGASLLAAFGRGGLIAASVTSLAAWMALGFAGGLAAFARTARTSGRAPLGVET